MNVTKHSDKHKNVNLELVHLDPEDRMKKLINYGDVKIDRRLSPHKYFTIVLESLNKADRLVKKGDLESAFIIYLKYINFCTINVKRDKIFLGASISDKAKCQIKLNEVIAKKDKLSTVIINEYKKNNKIHLKEMLTKEKILYTEPKYPQTIEREKLKTIILPKNVPSIFAVICNPINSAEITTIAALLATYDNDLLIIKDIVLTNYLYYGEYAYKNLVEEIAVNNNLTIVGYIHYHKYTPTILTKMDVLTLYSFEINFPGAIAVVVSYLGTVDTYLLSDVTVETIKHNLKVDGTIKDNLSIFPMFLPAINVLSDRYVNINIYDVRKGQIEPCSFCVHKIPSLDSKVNIKGVILE